MSKLLGDGQLRALHAMADSEGWTPDDLMRQALDHIAAQTEALAAAEQQLAEAEARASAHNVAYWGASQRADEAQEREQQARAEAAAKTLVIEDMLHNWWERIYPADIFVGDSPDADEGVKEVRRLRDAMTASLSGTAGKDILDELARLRAVMTNTRRAVGMWRNLMDAGWDNADCRAEAREATNDVGDALEAAGYLKEEASDG